MLHRRADAQRAVRQHLHAHALRQAGAQARQLALDGVHRLNHVRARLALHADDDGRVQRRLGVIFRCFGRHVGAHIAWCAIIFDTRPGAQAVVLGALHHPRHVLQADRRTVLVAHHQLAVLLGRQQLVVGVDRVLALGPVKTALGTADVARADGAAHRVQPQAHGAQRVGIALHPHGRPLAARQRHQAHPADLADLQRQPGVDHVLHLVQRQAVGGDGQLQHRRIRRVDLGVDRRRRQIGRQQRRGRVDGRLHLLLGRVHA